MIAEPQQVELGDRVKDTISGFTGIAIARTEWLHGCIRICIQPEKVGKDGKIPDNQTVDEPQCQVLKRAAVPNFTHWRGPVEVRDAVTGERGIVRGRRAAGPRPDAVRQIDPAR